MEKNNLKNEQQCAIHIVRHSLFLLKTFFSKTKQLGLMKTIKLFRFVYIVKKANKKSGNTSYGLYSMFDTTTGN
jgi:hypothetical protein